MGELSGKGERDNSALRAGASALKISKRIYDFYQLGNRLPNLKELGDIVASEGEAIVGDVGILIGEASGGEKLDALLRVVVGLDGNDLKDATSIYKKIAQENKSLKQESKKDEKQVGKNGPHMTAKAFTPRGIKTQELMLKTLKEEMDKFTLKLMAKNIIMIRRIKFFTNQKRAKKLLLSFSVILKTKSLRKV